MSRIYRALGTPNLNVAGAYGANNTVGAGVITFANALRRTSSFARLLNVCVIDLANQKIVGDLVLLNRDISTTTVITDNGATDVADTDMDSVEAVIPIPAANYASFADNAFATVSVGNLGLKRFTDGQDLYGFFITRGTPTYANGDLQFLLTLMED